MNWKKVEAYFGISVGLIFIILAFLLMASGLRIEGVCYLVLIVFGIIALIFGFYDYNRFNKIMANMNSTQTQHTNSLRFCPACGRHIPWDSNICPYCSNKFNENK